MELAPCALSLGYAVVRLVLDRVISHITHILVLFILQSQVSETVAGVSVAFPSCQLVLVVTGFFGCVCKLLTLVNLSVALLSMVNFTYVHEVEGADSNNSHETSECWMPTALRMT